MNKCLRLLIFLILSWTFVNAANIHGLKKIDLEDVGILKPEIMVVKGEIIFIWDEGTKRIYKIGKKLSVERAFSGKGEGPGEISFPLNMGCLKNKLWVFDFKQRLIEFDLDGNYLGENKTDFYGKIPGIIELVDESRFISSEREIKRNRETVKTLCFYSGQKRIKLSGYRYSLQDMLNFEKNIGYDWCVGRDYCFLTPPVYDYYIKVFNIKSEKFSKVLEKRDYKRVKYSKEEKETMQEKLAKIKSPPGSVGFNIKIPEYKSAIKDITADENDNLYVILNEKKNGKYLVEFYDRDLAYITNFFIPEFKTIKISQNKMYIIRESGTYYLEVYRLPSHP